MLSKEALEDPIVKSLQEAGFSDETIEEYIETGDIVLKSKETKEEVDEHEEENIVDDEKHIENLENDEKEDEKDIEKCGCKKKSCKKDDVQKGITADDLKEFGKALADSIVEGLSARFSGIEKSLETFGKQTPSFKGADLNGSVLEKSLDNYRDENNKLEVNIHTQRSVARSLIEKAIENADDNLMKSIGEDAKNFLMYPEADTVGENLAMYMYKNMNVKFVK